VGGTSGRYLGPRSKNPPLWWKRIQKERKVSLLKYQMQKLAGLMAKYGWVGKDFVYHACGHEVEFPLKWNIFNSPPMTLVSDYRGMAKWFGAHYNQEVRFSSAVWCKKGPRVLTSLLNQRRNYYYSYFVMVFSSIFGCFATWRPTYRLHPSI